MKVLVTGAGGFVCSQVAVALAAAGHEVWALDQAFDAPTRARLDGLSLIECNLPDGLGGLDLAPDAVVHGAATTASPEQLGIPAANHIRGNVDLLTAALDFARRAGATRFVNLSSMGVFDPGDGPVAEDRFTEVTVPTGACAYCIAKRAGELVVAGAAEAQFATLSLRLGNIFGPHEAKRQTRQHLSLAARMVAEARAGALITTTTPNALREWSWLPDLAGGIADLTVAEDFGTHPILHAGRPPVIRDLDLARAIATRIRGTTIRMGAPPHPRIRPPMASARPSVFSKIQWTSINAGLDLLLADAVQA